MAGWRTRDEVRRREALRLLATAAVGAGLMAGCAIPFGPGPDTGTDAETRRRQGNRLYLEEQERIERSRESFGNPYPSDR